MFIFNHTRLNSHLNVDHNSQNGARSFSFQAQSTRITRARYTLLPGDYVNIKFTNSSGFFIVSEPAGNYSVNVGSSCDNESSTNCQWRHSIGCFGYFLMGNTPALAQIVSVTGGTFQITVGYTTEDCCESIHGINSGSFPLNWTVPANSLACFIHTIQGGTFALHTNGFNDKQEIRAYNDHTLVRILDSDDKFISTTENIGALMLHNKGNTQEMFLFELELTDPNRFAQSPGYLPSEIAKQVTLPILSLGWEHNYVTWSFFTGGCDELTCWDGPPALYGNTGGMPATSDGDPIHDNEPQPSVTASCTVSTESDDITGTAVGCVIASVVVIITAVVIIYRKKKKVKPENETGESQVPNVMEPSSNSSSGQTFGMGGNAQATSSDYPVGSGYPGAMPMSNPGYGYPGGPGQVPGSRYPGGPGSAGNSGYPGGPGQPGQSFAHPSRPGYQGGGKHPF